ncbi:hypothetical protein H721_02669 [Brucella ovis IntaBari-2006-46-332]|uniref:Uncharacterized protein n=1 Tax=Brucella ovis (strain ATCC 25840 / 63/290 / NCTC 10512) TaxID=444178 RepID=A0A0H3AUD3_BRUO2|nr:hypothetical protein BOV_A0568 [Brucella ovis ATCC 25840]ENR00433.1 hypothetical protein C010_02837 [Brucella ovis 80/125]ENR05834.1 hypothetical protein C961_02537 [Brucella ovis F8/05B]ENS92219.1 hypothetical protein B999_02804 [Brucella ovis 63/96]ENS95731.1 hypothetical protein C009_02685 [Brucella ovis 81/8]ENT75513.1 hypothetical protein H712_02814 [Brucella ovis IntaBari-2009-88-4]ENT77513.1 hypothetical protein H720_02599 [Brucella ovis IntaBari-2006-46-348]ENT80963.1 hypothetical
MQRRATRREMFIYIEQLIDELAKLAKQAQNPMLVYLLEMAQEKARDSIEQVTVQD